MLGMNAHLQLCIGDDSGESGLLKKFDANGNKSFIVANVFS